MGRIGSSADNAMAESFNASLKRETLQGARVWDSAEVCRREVFRWVTRYDTRRRHSALDYRSPLAFETATTAATVGLVASLTPTPCPLLGGHPPTSMLPCRQTRAAV